MKEINFKLEGIDKEIEVYWNEDKEDFIVNMPQFITRAELLQIVDEVKHITHMND